MLLATYADISPSVKEASVFSGSIFSSGSLPASCRVIAIRGLPRILVDLSYKVRHGHQKTM